MGKTVFKGEEHFSAVERGLKDAVEEFISTLAHFGLGVAFEVGSHTLKEVQGTRKDLHGKTLKLTSQTLIGTQIYGETLQLPKTYKLEARRKLRQLSMPLSWCPTKEMQTL